ncbi:2-methylthioadenine synthetase MiaB [Thermoclostridium stercorarium subsp. stercorarium DSM 8532]|jgi:threonylcarbamoyladenosine tRNA methylthiotransferase MtaB|uniref:Threonylcarbamoyladenosine tRNA methylthiotransferase MtaB n=3 Tax=Thermoclostridium stercorarium TaxID=1510 RepID=L7VQP4_THES1|nr:tRNA (N(6)-L-threonylcarbamoyladenosine(37)-C(2))-methylthiotransferase MtaB [Thermoclostridium stercorarium]AGC69117.1 2-methylthioadenine synthetase MiaB [Thermoclostridium stercorarium subsp. stercorarium DSM 8532]AGI40087.1 tRNA modifying enzyme [Thermoclostridium stercorarium subsp. stercorarium DSM 8532]ANW99402.1 tRNA (N(6)-L-threonylcarbamoyladenosine(37)-C(2))-methylthiotransferase MtaB [Thermoclostridium stercorarium subsp. thermolacticum DSM 2910]ANX02027.1 tRNA (N(6)-L-threonylca
MKKVAFITLGCKVNTYETEGMKRLFEKSGYEVVEPDNCADVYVINTCTVTHLSDRKSRQMIRRARRLNPDAVIAAVGCYAQVAPEEVSKIEGVNLVIGNNRKSEIVELVEEVSRDEKKIEVLPGRELKEYEELWAGSYTGHTRAFLKIQDGCDQFCSYCIIPFARGRIRSRSMESIMDEARKLVDNGFKEIVLTGIHLTSYGKDTGKGTLLDVIRELDKMERLSRIRLGSLEPLYMTEEMIREMSGIEKLCPHFHLSLQSGCDETLARMNRKYTTTEYRGIVEKIRRYFEDVAITTDIMTGFPGETDAEFRKTCEFVQSIGFSQAHIFQYSVRKGTKAAAMKDQVPPEVKEERSKILTAICNNSMRAFRENQIGRVKDVLFEEKVDGYYAGHTDNYIPVRVLSDENLSGELLSVRLVKNEHDFMIGQLYNEK